MKTLNLTIDERTWQAARKLAAERSTSVSALAREALQHLTKTDDRRKEARRRILKMIGSFGGKVGAMPSREDRNAREHEQLEATAHLLRSPANARHLLASIEELSASKGSSLPFPT